LLPDNGVNADGLIDAAGFDRSWLINENGLSGIPWGCIILDRFQTPPEELARWSKLAPVIGIDEGGVSRNCFDFLIDILPGFYRSAANISDVSLLPLPEKLASRRDLTEAQRAQRTRRKYINFEFLCDLRVLRASVRDSLEISSKPAEPLKILVSFGQEDAAGLGLAAAEALADSNDGSMEISLLRGGLGSKKEALDDTKKLLMLLTIPDLVNHLREYDLVITHYGITAFEALYMGVPVLLVSPGALHERLAKAAGFYSLGIGKTAAKKLRRLLFRKGAINHLFLNRLKDRCSALAVKYNLDHTPRQSLAQLINGITPDVSRNCPSCGVALNSPALARYAERTYHRCAHCGTIAMNRLTPPPIEYGKEYFFEQYQQQYGKTYIEDFPNLTAMAKRRLAVIKRLKETLTEARRARSSRKEKGVSETAPVTPRLLDIGCAYGPFLAAAREEGFSPCGIDPAEDAVRYVTETLGVPAVQGFFPPTAHCSLLTAPYSVITLWYVIEHFRDCVPVLAEIRKLLKSGGVLAFATPSFTGISGRASLKKFLERSPADHWTIWSPAAAKKVLKTAGFTVKKVVNSGHHPERFPVLGKYAHSEKSPLYGLLLAVSKIFALGDTFEVYAVMR
jgi:2-polyprenyl-3-methyl-5-hydroxy-6-metoxy-1,4-benzoquinol methylase